MKKILLVSGILMSSVFFTMTASAIALPSCNSGSFDAASTGSVNGQDGWSVSNPAFDEVVTNNTYGYTALGCKTLRISDSVTSGSFGDQLFTPSVTNEAGEADALNNGLSGGIRRSHFEAQFDLASVMPTLQSGMHLSVSPDRGDGSRMSYLRFEDQADGIHVYFDDVTNPSHASTTTSFDETDIATINRTSVHTIKFVMDFVTGPDNDVVKIYIDGILVHTGTSWEDYYRFDPESNPSLISNSRTVDSLLFRLSGSANVANAGKGFLIDNLSISTNRTPVATTQSVTLNEDDSLSITLAGTDADTDPLTFAVTAGPSNGPLSGTTPLLTYTPSLNFNGTDSFDFKANDGITDSATTTVSITVNSVNDVPSFTKGANQTVLEDAGDQVVTDWVQASSTGPVDESAQILNYIVTNNNNSLFSVQPFVSATGTLYYTPAANANGVATVSVSVHDNGGTANSGVDTSAVQTFTITVTALNDAPTLAAVSDKSVNELANVSFTLAGADIDSGSLTYSASGAPAGSTLNPTTGAFSWTPTEAQGPGVYNFVAQVSDGSLVATTPVQITVAEVNVAPTTSNSTVATHQNTSLEITLVGSDVDVPVQTLTFTTTSSPSHGTLSVVSGNKVTYTPTDAYNGTDSFSFKTNDGVTDSNTSTVTINVNDLAPNLAAISDATTTEETLFTFTASATDLDNDPSAVDVLSYSLDGTFPSGASIDLSTGVFTWTPTEAQGPGIYNFTVKVSDGGPSPDSKSFAVEVTEVNKAPVAADQGELTKGDCDGECSPTVSGGVVTDEDTSKTITMTATDADIPVQSLSYSIVSGPEHGTLGDVSGGDVIYTPNLNYNGTDSFTFKANDGVVDSEVATVYITITPVNDAPIITLTNRSEYYIAKGNTYEEPGATATDIEQGDITEDIVITGSVDMTTVGTYSLTYTITDDGGLTDSKVRNVHVYAQDNVATGGNGVVGCRDSLATNYNPNATYDGAVCLYAPVGQVLGASTSTAPTTNNGTTTPNNNSTTTPATGQKGEVLGVETTCVASGPFLTQYARQGYRNDVDTVKKLQGFLNEQIGAKLPVTGFFGPMTTAALKKFQLAHKDVMLDPWKLTKATGILYVTTLNGINHVVCSDIPLNLNVELIPFEKNPDSPKKI